MPQILPEHPTVAQANTMIYGTACFFVFGAWALAGGPLTGISFIDVILNDSHYKYLIFLGIPLTAYFVIANWVGWQYYRLS
ncbi:hypothetical protein PIIN_01302 [Serendipita indica DSM 11827]|uniref:Uncharacterized protein n=1 Tax=Serendipita indica (strain DSM 11827) TaxID=1109443 RepID=G4T839_SERID|nr:hypothetical protein PIIN_01302 [Serendipita indica DSM 11827]